MKHSKVENSDQDDNSSSKNSNKVISVEEEDGNTVGNSSNSNNNNKKKKKSSNSRNKNTKAAKTNDVKDEPNDEEDISISKVSNVKPNKIEKMFQGKEESASDVFSKTYIDGGKVAYVSIDETGSVKNISNEALRPTILGEALLPVVLENGQVITQSGFSPMDNKLSTITFITDSKLEVKIQFPPLRYRGYKDVPVWIDYIILENRTLKVIRKPPFVILRGDFQSFETLFAKVMSLIFEIGNTYDVIRYDSDNNNEVDESTKDVSIITNKRSIENINLKGDRYNPMVVYKQIQGLNIPYDSVMSSYFTDANPTKDVTANIRRNAMFKVDDESWAKYQEFSRPPINVAQSLQLPPFIRKGVPSDNELQTFVNRISNIQTYVRQRKTNVNIPSVISRAFYYDLGIDSVKVGRVVDQLKNNRMLFDTFLSGFDQITRRCIVSSITFSTSVLNKLGQYFSQTKDGISALRKTAFTNVAGSMSPAVVPKFINAIMDLYFSSNVSMEFQLSTDLSVAWTFNAILFMFMMKPQVCHRTNVQAFVYQVAVNIAQMTNVPINQPVVQLLKDIGRFLTYELNNLINKWWVYSQSPIDRQRDYRELYTNYGYAKVSLSQIDPQNPNLIPDTSGYTFWGAPAFEPWADVPNAIDDTTWSLRLSNLMMPFQTVFGTTFQWSAIWQSMISVLLNSPYHSLTSSVSRLVSTMRAYASTELYTNRFIRDVKDDIIQVDWRALLSTAMFVEVTEVPIIQKYVPSFHVYIASLDYWLSELSFIHTSMGLVEKTLVGVVGLNGVTNTFYKPWSLITAAASMSSYQPIKDMLKGVNGFNYRLIDRKLDGTLDDRPFFTRLSEIYRFDMSLTTNSNWFCYTKALLYIINTDNWSEFGINTNFTVTPVEIKPISNEVIRSVMPSRPHSNLTIDYRLNYFKFGDSDFNRFLFRTLPFSQVTFKIPVFVNYKIEKEFKDNVSFSASTGESSVIEWLTKPKEPITSSSFSIHTIEMTTNMVFRWEVTFDDQTWLYDLYTPITENNYFINGNSNNDFSIIIDAPTRYMDVYLNQFVDSTVEFGEMFASRTTTTISGGTFVPRLVSYLATI